MDLLHTFCFCKNPRWKYTEFADTCVMNSSCFFKIKMTAGENSSNGILAYDDILSTNEYKYMDMTDMDHNRKRWQCPRKSSRVTTCLSLSKRYCSISWGIQHGGHCHDDHCFECPATKCHPGGATVSKQNQENDWWSGNKKTAKYFVFDFDEKRLPNVQRDFGLELVHLLWWVGEVFKWPFNWVIVFVCVGKLFSTYFCTIPWIFTKGYVFVLGRCIYTGTWNDNPSTIPSTATSCRRPFNPAQIASDALETVSNTQV